MLKKKQTRAFRKEIFLVGTDSNNIKYWLEEPSWDCGWYWGFGYIETYTNNNSPANSRDIDSHSHVDSGGLKNVINWTMTEEEKAKFFELFEKFYSYKHYSKDEKMNKVTFPALMDEIINLVSPTGDYKTEIPS